MAQQQFPQNLFKILNFVKKLSISLSPHLVPTIGLPFSQIDWIFKIGNIRCLVNILFKLLLCSLTDMIKLVCHYFLHKNFAFYIVYFKFSKCKFLDLI